MHYYPFHIADFALHTSHLTLEEEAVYRRLLDFYYDTEKPIPKETKPVIRRLRLGSYSDTVGQILSEFFVADDDGWRNLRADIEISSYHSKADTARENGRKGGRPKKTQGQKTKPVISANPDLTNEKANQEPRTKNHKPITNNKDKPARRFTPPTFQQVADYCFERNNTVDPQRFIDHYSANGWMRGKNKIKDWKACVRTWEQNSNSNYGSGNLIEHKKDDFIKKISDRSWSE